MIYLKTLARKLGNFHYSSLVFDNSRECFVKNLDNGISKIILNRPGKLNAVGKTFLKDFEDCIDYFSSNGKLLLIESSCEKSFCSGADLKERLEMTVDETIEFVDRLRNCFNTLAKLSIPTIACIDGLALGGGLELALACDIRVASFKSKLGLPETKLSIFPAAGGTQRLLWLIGPAKAKELIFAAEILDAEYAKMLGIINHVHENPVELCEAIATKILQNGPLGISGAKIAIDSQIQNLIDCGLTIEKNTYKGLMNSSDRLEGLRAFSEKRKPEFKGK